MAATPTHDAHDDAAVAFDGEPVRELSPDEPQTPMYLPVIGLALFLGLVLYLLVPKREEPPPAAAPVQTAAATASVPVAPPPPPAAPQQVAAPPSSAAARALADPDFLKKIEQLRKQRPPAATASAKAPPAPKR